MRKALVFLGILDDKDLEWIIRSGERRDIPTGSVLVHEGKQIDSVFLLLDGLLSVTTGVLGGKELARLAVGEIVGEMSFVDSRPPSATVTALRDSSVLVISRVDLSTKLEEDVDFAARFYRAMAVFLSDRLRSTVSHLGYGEEMRLEEDVEDKDEVPEHLMDNLSMAGLRFAELQRRVRGALS